LNNGTEAGVCQENLSIFVFARLLI